MAAADDLDVLIADFGNYGDLITTGDTIDRLQKVIIAFSDGTLQPPNDALGNDSMVWLCKLLKYLESKNCVTVGPELIPAGATYVTDGGTGAMYVVHLPGALATGNFQVVISSASPNVAIANQTTGGAKISFTQVAIITGFASNLTVTPNGDIYILGAAGLIGQPVQVSVKQLI